MTRLKSYDVWAALAAALVLAAPAAAGAVTVRLDENTVMDLRAPAGTVLIGNPGVVDVSLITPQRIAILGRGYGQTNVIITDRLGRVIFHENVNVAAETGSRVSVYRGQLVSNFTCSPRCERTPTPGEDKSSYELFSSPYKEHGGAGSGGSGGGGGSQAAPAD